MEADDVVRVLNLKPHVEGGFFRETHRSTAIYEPGPPYVGPRSAGTTIYYLLTAGTYSSLHRLPGDEVFHFYLGDPVETLVLRPDGTSDVVVLGSDLNTMNLQHVVPGGAWQGSRLVAGGSWGLLGCTVAPGFEYADFEVPTNRDLFQAFPSRRSMIEALWPKPLP